MLALRFNKELQRVGLDIHCTRLEHGLPAFWLIRKVGNNPLGLRNIFTGCNDAGLRLLGTAWIDAGDGCNAQFTSLDIIICFRMIGNCHTLRHDVLHTGMPILIADGIGKRPHGKSPTGVFVGLCPTSHTLVSKTVLQHIMVNLLGFDISCDSVLDTKAVRHHKHHGDLLSTAYHIRIVGNHLGNIGLDATGFIRIFDVDGKHRLNTISDGDILQLNLEAINNLPSAVV